MDRIKGFAVFVAVLIGVLVWVPQAQAGQSHIYLQGCQAELGTSTPATVSVKTDAANGQPYCVIDYTVTTADTAYYHFVVPQDYDTTNTASDTVIVKEGYFAETDNTALHNACWKASVTVFDISANYRTTALTGVGGTYTPTQASAGQYYPASSTTVLTNFIEASSGVACINADCRGKEAVLALQRVNCLTGTPVSGAAAGLYVDVQYSN